MANTTGYKALVMVYLQGGLDHNDTIIPYDQPSWDKLKGYRGNVLSNDRVPSNLLKLNPLNEADFGGRQFGMPQEMLEIHQMFEEGDAAIIGNVGALIQPITKQDVLEGNSKVPGRLGSHNDHATYWQALGFEGTKAGWGGKLLDATRSNTTDPTFAGLSTTGKTVFLNGKETRQSMVGDPKTLAPELTLHGSYPDGNNQARDAFWSKVKEHYRTQKDDASRENLFARDFNTLTSLGHANSEKMFNALKALTPLTTQFPTNSMGRYFNRISNTIQIRETLQAERQIFYVYFPGFDTHRDQGKELPWRQRDLSAAIGAFRQAMIEIGVWDDVTVFTAGDFGRTLVGNSNNGTDHAWGGHHFMMGGSIKGKTMYGDYPQFDINSDSYYSERGTLVPTLAVEQYAATLARWFGLTEEEIHSIFTNLKNFPTQDLGFFNV